MNTPTIVTQHREAGAQERHSYTLPVRGVPSVEAAEELAEELLEPLGNRWAHTRAVAARAERLTPAVTPVRDRRLLVVAAWWHDLGYAPALRDTGCHQSDVPASWLTRTIRSDWSRSSRITRRLPARRRSGDCSRSWRCGRARSRRLVRRAGEAVEGLLLEGEVGVQVDHRGVGLLVAEPERDHGGVHAGRGRAIAQLCRKVCGVMFRPVRDGQAAACLATSRSTASRDSGSCR